MKLIGKTYREVFNAPIFGPVESDNLTQTFLEVLGVNDDDFLTETVLNANTDDGSWGVGRFLEIENEDDIDQMIMDTECPDIRLPEEQQTASFDLIKYINTEETAVIATTCTTNAGGDIYVFLPHIVKQFPSIHEHVFNFTERRK